MGGERMNEEEERRRGERGEASPQATAAPPPSSAFAEFSSSDAFETTRPGRPRRWWRWGDAVTARNDREGCVGVRVKSKRVSGLSLGLGGLGALLLSFSFGLSRARERALLPFFLWGLARRPVPFSATRTSEVEPRAGGNELLGERERGGVFLLCVCAFGNASNATRRKGCEPAIGREMKRARLCACVPIPTGRGRGLGLGLGPSAAASLAARLRTHPKPQRLTPTPPHPTDRQAKPSEPSQDREGWTRCKGTRRRSSGTLWRWRTTSRARPSSGCVLGVGCGVWGYLA